MDIFEEFRTALTPSIDAGLLAVDGRRVRLTRRGVLMSSEVLSALI